jgi:hypothetical protein
MHVFVWDLGILRREKQFILIGVILYVMRLIVRSTVLYFLFLILNINILLMDF